MANLQPDVTPVSLDELLKINSFAFLSISKTYFIKMWPLKYGDEV